MVNIFQAGTLSQNIFQINILCLVFWRQHVTESFFQREQILQRQFSVFLACLTWISQITLYVCPVQFCQQMEGDIPIHIGNHVWRHKWGTLGITFFSASHLMLCALEPNSQIILLLASRSPNSHHSESFIIDPSGWHHCIQRHKAPCL